MSLDAGTICTVIRTLGARLLKVCGEGAMNDAIIELCRMNDDGDADALGRTGKGDRLMIADVKVSI